MNRLTLALFCSLALGVAGCAQQDDDQDEEMMASTSAALSASLSVDGLDRLTTADPRQAATEASVTVPSDTGCRTRRVDADDPNVVYVTLNNCTKRFGKHVIDGEMKLTFSQGERGLLHVERESLRLTVDGLPASHRASTDIVFDGEQRVATTQGVWERTRDDGSRMTRTGSHTVTFQVASKCRSSSGSSTVQIDGEEVGSGVSELAWCELDDGSDSCPVGEIEHSRPSKGKHVTKRFDGTATATAEISTRRGVRTRQIPLVCTPQR